MEEIDQAEVERIAKFFNDRCFTCGGTKKIRWITGKTYEQLKKEK